MHTALRVADVSAEQFYKLVEIPTPPTDVNKCEHCSLTSKPLLPRYDPLPKAEPDAGGKD